MYNLDFETTVTALSPEFMRSLSSNGYLQSIPRDPGAGEEPGVNYFLCGGESSNFQVECLIHGAIQSRYKIRTRPEGSVSCGPGCVIDKTPGLAEEARKKRSEYEFQKELRAAGDAVDWLSPLLGVILLGGLFWWVSTRAAPPDR